MSDAKPEISFALVDRDNFRECVSLKVAPRQKRFVASNVFSIAQSKVEPECVPTVIYADGKMVGFAMYALDEGEMWILRFMISTPNQGRGLGRAALEELVRHIRQLPDCNGSITLSYEPDNTVAENLYESLGFRKTGEIEDGEVISKLESGTWT